MQVPRCSNPCSATGGARFRPAPLRSRSAWKPRQKSGGSRGSAVRSADTASRVEELTRLIENTDSGASVSAAKRGEIDTIIESLIETGNAQSDALDDEAIFGNYAVSYTSPGADQNGAPAGGRFRGRLGRLLFRTNGLYQLIAKPDVCCNLVRFKLFGLLPGCVSLKGSFSKIKEQTVEVLFKQPTLTLCGLTLGFGPKSKVELVTPFLDRERGVRIGKGSRGSLFVFIKGEEADSDVVMGDYERVPSRMAPFQLAGAVAAIIALLAVVNARLGFKPLLAIAALLLVPLAVVKGGGIVDDDYSAKAAAQASDATMVPSSK